ncbi:MAG: hypothetical protein QOG79_7966, partial [Mycobacterium sp.]|nr:hypothetical protein [Mycobacterium sp.]
MTAALSGAPVSAVADIELRVTHPRPLGHDQGAK